MQNMNQAFSFQQEILTYYSYFLTLIYAIIFALNKNNLVPF